MEKWLTDILPIADVEHDAILSKQGDISFVYWVELPEIFTLSADEYESIHQGTIRALKALPAGCIFHKQDYFMRKRYAGEAWQGQQSFLNKAAEQYFMDRPYLDHECYIILTHPAKDRKPASSMLSNLVRPSMVSEQTISADWLRNWENNASQFVRLMRDAGIVLERLQNDALVSTAKKAGLLERYCFLLPSSAALTVKDIAFDKEGIQVGSQRCQLFTIADADALPTLAGPCVTYDKYSTDRTNFPLSFAAPCGLLLDCNHVYNQVISIKDGFETRKALEKRALRLRSLAAYSRENAISHEAVNAYLNEAVSEGRIPAGIHCNIMTIADNIEEAREQANAVTAALAGMDAVAKLETVGAPQLFWACMPGNESDLPQNEVFGSFIEQASCFLNLETNYRTLPPSQGIRFCDRLTGKPVFADFLDEPRQAGISTNMGMLVCGSSGGGKSMTVNHILRTLYDQGAHVLVVDIGGSYKGLCGLVKGAYLSYEEDKPIQFNPFYIAPGDILDTEKKESLKALLVALWKQENENYNRSEYVALSNALQGYFQLLKEDASIFPCFDSFYEYLGTQYVEVLKAHHVKAGDFDIDNFLYVLRPYYKDNEFGFLLNARQNLDLLNQPFVVVEMDNLKDHPILFPVTALSIVELFISKMRKLKGTRKVLAIDEAWKAITKSGMAEFLKYAFKTIRKFNGVPIVITQELDDLISSPIIKDAIINNADIKVLMDMRKFVNKFDKLQEALGLSEKAKTILLSVNKDNREIYTEVGGQIMKVYKNELSPHEYYAYTTEGREKVKVLEYAEKYGDMQAGIDTLVRDMEKDKSR